MRTLGLDHGTKRIGIALSDPMGWTARGFGVLEITDDEERIHSLLQIIKEEGVEEVVVGLPRNMDGTIGPRAEDVLRFVELLKEHCPVPVHTVDERLTSKEADTILRRNRRHAKSKRGGAPHPSHAERDIVAAQILLTDHLEARRNPPPPENP